MDEKSEHLQFFADSKVVRGSRRSVIYDLSRNGFKFIPNGLYDIISNFEGKTIADIKSSYPKDAHNVIDNYLDFLFGNDYLFYCDKDELNLFPKLNLTWDYPALISNTIVDIDMTNADYFEQTFVLIESIGCKDVVLRILNLQDIGGLEKCLRSLKGSRFKSIDLVIANLPLMDLSAIQSLIVAHPRINSIIIFEASKNEIIEEKNTRGYVALRNEQMPFVFRFNGVNKSSFTINMGLFMESQKHHTYFNRKLYLDSEGNIKNSPESENKYGNIRDLSNSEDLKQIITKPEFQQYWYVHKEQIDVCKDCEFRHMCVENRIPIQREDGSWYHGEECNYNPYICKWEDEEGYQNLEDCGIIVSEKGYYRDDLKLVSINEELW